MNQECEVGPGQSTVNMGLVSRFEPFSSVISLWWKRAPRHQHFCFPQLVELLAGSILSQGSELPLPACITGLYSSVLGIERRWLPAPQKRGDKLVIQVTVKVCSLLWCHLEQSKAALNGCILTRLIQQASISVDAHSVLSHQGPASQLSKHDWEL